MKAEEVVRALKKCKNKERAAQGARFFKTGKGEYGEGDQFLGLTVPLQRRIARQHRELSLSETEKLLRNPFHDCRFTALVILIGQFQNGDAKTRGRIARLYLKNRKYINNWDLVDVSADKILGDYFLKQDRSRLYALAKSRSLWDRRIAIMTTFAFVRKHDFRDTLAIAEILLHDPRDLIHKAVGWMLREVGNRDRRVAEKFLKEHHATMPRTMLRYAIEKFPHEKRARYLGK